MPTPKPVHDADIIAYIERCRCNPGVHPPLTLYTIGRAVGLNTATVSLRLKKLREAGVITYEPGRISTVQIAPGWTLPDPLPVGRPRRSGGCTARGCTNPRHGDQWCLEHERAFVERYRKGA